MALEEKKLLSLFADGTLPLLSEAGRLGLNRLIGCQAASGPDSCMNECKSSALPDGNKTRLVQQKSMRGGPAEHVVVKQKLRAPSYCGGAPAFRAECWRSSFSGGVGVLRNTPAPCAAVMMMTAMQR